MKGYKIFNYENDDGELYDTDGQTLNENDQNFVVVYKNVHDALFFCPSYFSDPVVCNVIDMGDNPLCEAQKFYSKRIRIDSVVDGEVVDEFGNYAHFKNGKLHRDSDLPAIIADGRNEWYMNGKLHRNNDLPAVEYKDGTKEWWKNGIKQE